RASVPMIPEWCTAIRRVVQSPRFATQMLGGLFGAGAGVCAAAVVTDPVPSLRHNAVILSAGLTVAWMFLAWLLMLAMPREVMPTRLAWTLGLLTLFLHLVLAFGVAHGWSHAAAVEHVREVGGVGAGIAASYLF